MSRSMIQGELVEIKSSFEDRTEQVKVDDFLSESCGCKLGPPHVACSSVVSKGQFFIQGTMTECCFFGP